MITTSTPPSLDPRTFVQLLPPPTSSHIGLKITARSETPVYTCESPTRREVAEENYIRRSHHYNYCGYNSANTLPYKCIGKVCTDDKKLILTSLGQVENRETKQIVKHSSHHKKIIPCPPPQRKSKVNHDESKVAVQDEKEARQRTKQDISLLKLQPELSRGLKQMHKVRLGISLFRIMKEEEKQKREEHENKIKEREKDLKNIMHIQQLDSSDEEETDNNNQPIETNRALSCKNSAACEVMPTSVSPDQFNSKLQTGSPYSERLDCSPVNDSASHSNILLKKYKKKMPRPHSPLYSNLNFYESACKEAVFRQLCCISWILETMSQDNVPMMMTPIASSWKLMRGCSPTTDASRRAERDKAVHTIWQSFVINPSKYCSKRSRKRSSNPTRKLSSPVSPKSPLEMQDNVFPTSVHDNIHRDNSSIGVFSRKNRHESISTNQHVLPVKVAFNEEEEDRSNTGKLHSTSLRAATASGKSRFASAARKAMGVTVISRKIENVCFEQRKNMMELNRRQSLQLHDKMEVRERQKVDCLERKYQALKVCKDVNRALLNMRSQSKYKNESYQEKKERYSNECEWFVGLVNKLPDHIKRDIYCAHAIDKLADQCSIETRKINSHQFMKALSLLRDWEIASPDVSAAIEFVRDKVVGMSNVELESFLNEKSS